MEILEFINGTYHFFYPAFYFISTRRVERMVHVEILEIINTMYHSIISINSAFYFFHPSGSYVEISEIINAIYCLLTLFNSAFYFISTHRVGRMVHVEI